MIAISMFISADPDTDDIRFVWRDVLMRMFFDGITEEGMNEFSRHDRNRDFCFRWQGITCDHGRVKSVHYSECIFGNFNIDALPPTVVYLCINLCEQNFQMQMRSLPRELTYLSLSNNNGIIGRADLSHLPTHLTTAFLGRNKLHGPIELTGLPLHLKSLDLHNNNIRQQTVYYDNLPESIERVRLDGNKIREIRAINENRIVANKKIFRKISFAHIH